jgi:hypothetical protein
MSAEPTQLELPFDSDPEPCAEWSDERCPECGARTLENPNGTHYCSSIDCDYGLWTEPNHPIDFSVI